MSRWAYIPDRYLVEGEDLCPRKEFGSEREAFAHAKEWNRASGELVVVFMRLFNFADDEFDWRILKTYKRCEGTGEVPEEYRPYQAENH